MLTVKTNYEYISLFGRFDFAILDINFRGMTEASDLKYGKHKKYYVGYANQVNFYSCPNILKSFHEVMSTEINREIRILDLLQDKFEIATPDISSEDL